MHFRYQAHQRTTSAQNLGELPKKNTLRLCKRSKSDWGMTLQRLSGVNSSCETLLPEIWQWSCKGQTERISSPKNSGENHPKIIVWEAMNTQDLLLYTYRRSAQRTTLQRSRTKSCLLPPLVAPAGQARFCRGRGCLGPRGEIFSRMKSRCRTPRAPAGGAD